MSKTNEDTQPVKSSAAPNQSDGQQEDQKASQMPAAQSTEIIKHPEQPEMTNQTNNSDSETPPPQRPSEQQSKHPKDQSGSQLAQTQQQQESNHFSQEKPQPGNESGEHRDNQEKFLDADQHDANQQQNPSGCASTNYGSPQHDHKPPAIQQSTQPSQGKIINQCFDTQILQTLLLACMKHCVTPACQTYEDRVQTQSDSFWSKQDASRSKLKKLIQAVITILRQNRKETAKEQMANDTEELSWTSKMQIREQIEDALRVFRTESTELTDEQTLKTLAAYNDSIDQPPKEAVALKTEVTDPNPQTKLFVARDNFRIEVPNMAMGEYSQYVLDFVTEKQIEQNQLSQEGPKSNSLVSFQIACNPSIQNSFEVTSTATTKMMLRDNVISNLLTARNQIALQVEVNKDVSYFPPPISESLVKEDGNQVDQRKLVNEAFFGMMRNMLVQGCDLQKNLESQFPKFRLRDMSAVTSLTTMQKFLHTMTKLCCEFHWKCTAQSQFTKLQIRNKLPYDSGVMDYSRVIRTVPDIEKIAGAYSMAPSDFADVQAFLRSQCLQGPYYTTRESRVDSKLCRSYFESDDVPAFLKAFNVALGALFPQDSANGYWAHGIRALTTLAQNETQTDVLEPIVFSFLGEQSPDLNIFVGQILAFAGSYQFKAPMLSTEEIFERLEKLIRDGNPSLYPQIKDLISQYLQQHQNDRDFTNSKSKVESVNKAVTLVNLSQTIKAASDTDNSELIANFQQWHSGVAETMGAISSTMRGRTCMAVLQLTFQRPPHQQEANSEPEKIHNAPRYKFQGEKRQFRLLVLAKATTSVSGKTKHLKVTSLQNDYRIVDTDQILKARSAKFDGKDNQKFFDLLDQQKNDEQKIKDERLWNRILSHSNIEGWQDLTFDFLSGELSTLNCGFGGAERAPNKVISKTQAQLYKVEAFCFAHMDYNPNENLTRFANSLFFSRLTNTDQARFVCAKDSNFPRNLSNLSAIVGDKLQDLKAKQVIAPSSKTSFQFNITKSDQVKATSFTMTAETEEGREVCDQLNRLAASLDNSFGQMKQLFNYHDFVNETNLSVKEYFNAYGQSSSDEKDKFSTALKKLISAHLLSVKKPFDKLLANDTFNQFVKNWNSVPYFIHHMDLGKPHSEQLRNEELMLCPIRNCSLVFFDDFTILQKLLPQTTTVIKTLDHGIFDEMVARLVAVLFCIGVIMDKVPPWKAARLYGHARCVLNAGLMIGFQLELYDNGRFDKAAEIRFMASDFDRKCIEDGYERALNRGVLKKGQKLFNSMLDNNGALKSIVSTRIMFEHASFVLTGDWNYVTNRQPWNVIVVGDHCFESNANSKLIRKPQDIIAGLEPSQNKVIDLFSEVMLVPLKPLDTQCYVDKSVLHANCIPKEELAILRSFKIDYHRVLQRLFHVDVSPGVGFATHLPITLAENIVYPEFSRPVKARCAKFTYSKETSITNSNWLPSHWGLIVPVDLYQKFEMSLELRAFTHLPQAQFEQLSSHLKNGVKRLLRVELFTLVAFIDYFQAAKQSIDSQPYYSQDQQIKDLQEFVKQYGSPLKVGLSEQDIVFSNETVMQTKQQYSALNQHVESKQMQVFCPRDQGGVVITNSQNVMGEKTRLFTNDLTQCQTLPAMTVKIGSDHRVAFGVPSSCQPANEWVTSVPKKMFAIKDLVQARRVYVVQQNTKEAAIGIGRLKNCFQALFSSFQFNDFYQVVTWLRVDPAPWALTDLFFDPQFRLFYLNLPGLITQAPPYVNLERLVACWTDDPEAFLQKDAQDQLTGDSKYAKQKKKDLYQVLNLSDEQTDFQLDYRSDVGETLEPRWLVIWKRIRKEIEDQGGLQGLHESQNLTADQKRAKCKSYMEGLIQDDWERDETDKATEDAFKKFKDRYPWAIVDKPVRSSKKRESKQQDRDKKKQKNNKSGKPNNGGKKKK